MADTALLLLHTKARTGKCLLNVQELCQKTAPSIWCIQMQHTQPWEVSRCGDRLQRELLPMMPRRMNAHSDLGLFPSKHSEEHGVHLSPGQELHHKQSDEEPLPVLSLAEVLRCGNVQRV
ncbi:hypothetical protein ATANTOWER_015314 [Ataeniobius toweri]|uniref:Uncharacterized protein n=1 Tax=Ataeniobius toweri TaxID=208326 RepID=A0ABU7BGT3_9TELE|nr:hypothetical protein [Ataeniobius toweri]